MKLLKFNLIFIPFLALCLGTVGYIARGMLLEDAREHVIQNARIIMETMLSSRTYTTKQVAPLLEQKNFKLQTAIEQVGHFFREMNQQRAFQHGRREFRSHFLRFLGSRRDGFFAHLHRRQPLRFELAIRFRTS